MSGSVEATSARCSMGSSKAYSTWRDEVGRNLLNLDFRATGEAPFTFQMRPLLMTDGLRVVVNQHSSGYTFRDEELVRDGTEDLAIVYPVRSRLRYSQRGEDVVLGTHDPVLIDTAVPGELGAPADCNYISLIFPRNVLPPNVERLRLENRRWPRGAQALRLLRSYVDTLAGAKIPPQSELADTAQRHVLDLVRLAANECADRDSSDLLAHSTIAEARVRIALGTIEKTYGDPCLTVAEIAAGQGISARHLQRLFEQSGLRLTECITDSRLADVYRRLTDPAQAARPILEIAMCAGFSDASYFNRVFKRRFGLTPSDVRRSGR